MLLKFLNIVASSLLILIVLVGFSNLIETAIQKQDRVDCLQWQKNAKELSAYFITKEQKVQCDYFDVSIDAPIKN